MYMKQRILQFGIALLVIGAIFMPTFAPTHAQEALIAEVDIADELGVGPQFDVGVQGLLCRGDKDWSTFISATLGYDSFTEYWKDILIRYNTNLCYYNDIDFLLKRVDKARTKIRDAFYACTDTTRLKQRYYELEAELFFLRKYINTDNGQFLEEKNERTLIDALRDYFVLNKGFLKDDEILALFTQFKNRYKARLATYQDCSDPTWGALVEKWNQFKNDVGGFAPALQQAKRSFEKRWDKLAKAPWRTGGGYFAGLLDVRVNNLPAEQGFKQIGEALSQEFPEGYTFEQLETAKSNSDTNFQYANLEAQYLAQYQIQYGESSDAFTRQIVASLKTLQGIIEDTAPFQRQTIQCAKSVNSKQC